MDPKAAYLNALALLRDAEHLASRYPTPACLQRVIDAQRNVHQTYERMSAEARSHLPVGIGVRRAGYLRTDRRVPRNTYVPRRTDLY